MSLQFAPLWFSSAPWLRECFEQTAPQKRVTIEPMHKSSGPSSETADGGFSDPGR